MDKGKKLYSEEDVKEALRLTAMGTAGILEEKDAKETLEKLPKDLANWVIASTIAAHKSQELVMAAAMMGMGILGGMNKNKSEKFENSEKSEG